MEWQDALRRVDADLAAGRIDRAEHTKLRDQILAAAAAPRTRGAAPASTSPLDTEATQVIRRPAAYPPVVPPVDGHVVFATAGRRRPVGALLVIAALVVAAAGVWWFVARDGGSGAVATTTTTATQAAVTGIPALPGAATVPGRTLSPDEAVAAKLLSLTESDLLRSNDVNVIEHAASMEGATSYAVVVVRTDSPERAREVADGLTRHLEKSGYARTADGHLRRAAEQSTVVRSIYTSGNAVVRVGVAEATPSADLTAPITDALASVRRSFPPA